MSLEFRIQGVTLKERLQLVGWTPAAPGNNTRLHFQTQLDGVQSAEYRNQSIYPDCSTEVPWYRLPYFTPKRIVFFHAPILSMPP